MRRSANRAPIVNRSSLCCAFCFPVLQHLMLSHSLLSVFVLLSLCWARYIFVWLQVFSTPNFSLFGCYTNSVWVYIIYIYVCIYMHVCLHTILFIAACLYECACSGAPNVFAFERKTELNWSLAATINQSISCGPHSFFVVCVCGKCVSGVCYQGGE